MNEPFLLSNLIDLQDIDNEITKLIKKKSEGDTVLELKKLEQKYKEITKAIEISKEAMDDYFNEKKDFDKKLLENENKLSSIEMKLQDTKLNASELQNYNLQKSNVQVLIEDVFNSIDLLNNNNKDGLIEIEKFQNELSSLKPKLVEISKMLQIEWKDIDSNMTKHEQEKSNLINSFPDEIKFLYDELKSQGVEIIAAYKNDTQCGCCGVSLTSSEMDSIQESKFQQCPYCQGVLV
jgi:predicted  nucleic acid-binding Zn-ribbon protein